MIFISHFTIFLSAFLILQSSGVEAQTPRSNPPQEKNSSDRGSEQAPFVIKILPSEKQNELGLGKDAGERTASADRLVKPKDGWTTGDLIALAASVAALLQFFALIATLWVMIRTSRRQLRAYILPTEGYIGEGATMSPPVPAKANDIFANIHFKNSGQTPGYEIISWAQINVLEPVNEDKLIVPPLAQGYPSALGANAVLPKALWFGRALTATEIADINNQVKAIYYYGRIEYRDAFKISRYTNFRFRYNGPFPPPPGVLWLNCQEGNDAN